MVGRYVYAWMGGWMERGGCLSQVVPSDPGRHCHIHWIDGWTDRQMDVWMDAWVDDGWSVVDASAKWYLQILTATVTSTVPVPGPEDGRHGAHQVCMGLEIDRWIDGGMDGWMDGAWWMPQPSGTFRS